MKNATAPVAVSTLQWELKAYLSLCESINTPRSLACAMLVRNDEWGDLLKQQNHFDDGNVEQSALDYLVSSVLKKNPRLPLGVDTEQAALHKFLECETHVRQTNLRLSQGFNLAPPEVQAILRRARRIIRKILGDLSARDLESVWHECRFGPGATSHVAGMDVSNSRKYSALGATPRLAHVLKKLLPTAWYDAAGTLSIPLVTHSCVTTVPKTALTDRPICIEPHLNIWVQLGIGGLIREKLKRFGLDLDHGADWNRVLASYAKAWDLATIDLESASDTIARRLVELLLPERWLHLLDLARTDLTQMPDGTIIGLEKWSSMGNGYTFELESMIFYALSLACSRTKALTSAFGDDIIVPQDCTTDLISTLEYCGFRVNRSKTFLAGSFFESCGTDWLNGIDIRPFYFKSEVTNHEDQIDAIFKACNRIRQYANNLARNTRRHGCDRRFLPAWLRVHSALPRKWASCRIPVGVGDDRGLISNFDEAVPTYDRTFGQYNFRTRIRRPVRVEHHSELGALLAFTRQQRGWASKFTSNHRAGRWSIGDYIAMDPQVSIKQARKLVEGLPVLMKKVEPPGSDLRKRKGKGQHAIGHITSWPSLGPWQ